MITHQKSIYKIFYEIESLLTKKAIVEMHSMLKEFYDFIAKRINRYFLEISAEGALQKGESFFYLKLDDLDTVQKVADAIKDLATKGDNCGEYEYQCMDGSVYRTFTLKVIDNEIIIAAQINNMTNDFLCATLRNAANVVGKPLLMISSNPIDSAKKWFCRYGSKWYAILCR